MTESSIIRAFTAKLIEKLGGFDATAALLTARFGKEVHKGTLSKRQSGELEWPLSHIWALEDATGDHCISRYRSRQLPEVIEGMSLMNAAASLALESGEAIAAVAKLAAGKGSREAARKEVADMISAGTGIAAYLASEEE